MSDVSDIVRLPFRVKLYPEKLTKQGVQLRLRIPNDLAEQYTIEKGHYVVVTLHPLNSDVDIKFPAKITETAGSLSIFVPKKKIMKYKLSDEPIYYEVLLEILQDRKHSGPLRVV